MNIKNITFSILLFSFVVLKSVNAQNKLPEHFIGINPSVTVEPFYLNGEFDVNIFPLVFQKSISPKIDFRLSSILNLGVRKSQNKISHYGMEVAIPYFLTKSKQPKNDNKGFFITPVIGFTRNEIASNNNLGLWVEPGYHLVFENRIAMSFGLQTGTTYFHFDNGKSDWMNHFGVKVIIGTWF